MYGHLHLFGTVLPVLLIGAFLFGVAMLRRGRLGRSGSPANEITIGITDAAFEAKSGLGIRLEWRKVHSVIETETLFVFATHPGVGHFLPKRVVSDAEIGMLRRFLREKLGSRATLQEPASV